MSENGVERHSIGRNGKSFRFDYRAVGLMLFLLTHLGAALWFGSSIKTQVPFMRESLATMTVSLDSLTNEVNATAVAASAQNTLVEVLRDRQRELERRIEQLERGTP